MRKSIALLSSLGLVGSAFAQGESSLTSTLATEATTEIGTLSTAIGPVLVAAFGIAVGFVAYKLIKRALNKA